MSVGDGAREGQMFRGSDQRTLTIPANPVILIDLLALIAQDESQALKFKRSVV